MAASTNQIKKNINRQQSQVNREKFKALDTIHQHLDELKNLRPTSVLAHNKSERTLGTVKKILKSAHEVFVNDGHAGLSLRKVADRAGIAVGNLTYHFPSKTELLEAMLRESLSDYVEAHLEQFEQDRDTPLDILLNVVEFYVRNARQEHRFFYQIWGYAGSNEEAKTMVRNLYLPIGRFVYYLVRAANPKLNDLEVRQATLQIFSLEEGYKLFIGMGPDNAEAIATAEADIRALTKRIVMGG